MEGPSVNVWGLGRNCQEWSDKTWIKSVGYVCAAYLKSVCLRDIVDFGKDINNLIQQRIEGKTQHNQRGNRINCINGRKPLTWGWGLTSTHKSVCVNKEKKVCVGKCIKGMKESGMISGFAINH